MKKRWSNKYLDLEAEINNLGLIDPKSVIVNYKLDDGKIKTFKINNNDYPIVRSVKNNIAVDESMLANKILTDLYDNNEIAPAFLSGESGEYLVKKAGDKNFYYEDKYIYDLYSLKAFRQSKLSKYIDSIDDEYLKQANITLNKVIDELSLYDCKILANNDLHFELSDKENKEFGKIKPVYRCNKQKVNGLLKHVKNSMAKHNTLDIVNVKEFIKILKRKTKDSFYWENRKDDSFYKLLRTEDNVSFDLLIEDNNVNIFGRSNKNFGFNQIEEIIEFLLND